MILNSNDTNNKNNNNMSSDSDNEFSSKYNSLNTNIKAPSPISISAQSDAESLEMEAEPQNNFLCSFCSKKYLHRQSLQRHINKTHPKEKEKTNSSAKIKCQEESCNTSCRYLYQLRDHLMESHGFQFKLRSEMFDSYAGMCF